MNSELEVFNDPDVIVAQTQAGVSSTIFQAAPVTGGAVTSIGGATGGTITINSSAPDGISITPTGLPGTLTLTVVVTNAPTLLSVLGGLDREYSGRVQVFGQDLSMLSDAQLSQLRNERIGFVFQRFYLMPTLTAEENVQLPMAEAGVAWLHLPIADFGVPSGETLAAWPAASVQAREVLAAGGERLDLTESHRALGSMLEAINPVTAALLGGSGGRLEGRYDPERDERVGSPREAPPETFGDVRSGQGPRGHRAPGRG